jgi:FlaG/FlaF family flagellin (archaellin)
MASTDTHGPDRGVSNTVGVVAMVGIVVLLAATMWVLAAGLSDGLGPAPPQASFTFEYETGVSDPNCASDPCEVVRVVHASGDTFDPERVEVVVHYVDGGTDQRYVVDWADVVADPVDASDRIRVWNNAPIDTLASARIELFWRSADGQHSDVIGRWEGPAAS